MSATPAQRAWKNGPAVGLPRFSVGRRGGVAGVVAGGLPVGYRPTVADSASRAEQEVRLKARRAGQEYLEHLERSLLLAEQERDGLRRRVAELEARVKRAEALPRPAAPRVRKAKAVEPPPVCADDSRSAMKRTWDWIHADMPNWPERLDVLGVPFEPMLLRLGNMRISPVEAAALVALARVPGRVVPYSEIEWRVWGSAREKTRNSTMLALRLRERLAKAGIARSAIETLPFVGLRLRTEPAGEES